MSVRRKLSNAFRSKIVGLALLVGSGCPPGNVPGQNFPGYNLFEGATMELYEKDLQKSQAEGNPVYSEFYNINGFGLELIVTGVLPNYSGGNLGIYSAPAGGPFKPAPFDVDLKIMERSDLGIITRFRINYLDNANDSFVNGESWTGVIESFNNGGAAVPLSINFSYSRGNSPENLTEIVENIPPGNTGQPGQDGQSGINCWDLNGNRINDPSEDRNGDGVFDARDCQITAPEAFNLSYLSINNNIKGTGDANIYLGQNKANLFYHGALESLVGPPDGINYEELGSGVAQPGCFRVGSYSPLVRNPSLDGNGFLGYTSNFNMVSGTSCSQSIDYVQAKVTVNGFNNTINDAEFAYNQPKP